MHYPAAVLWSLPWIIPPVVTYFRLRNSRSLDDESDVPPDNPPLVSVIVPARNEAHNIARCVKSILSTTYPNLELIVVDDSSTDGTSEIARDAAERDPRARFIASPPLPDGWFGKQWACVTGAKLARGSVLQFTDADTVHAPDLVTRSMSAMRRTRAQLFSVAGRQELGGFWEKVIQPQIFSILATRYGGTESITKATNVRDKIANGQCFFVTHDSYNSIGGHASVRASVAEDMMLAQKFFAARKRVVVMLGVDQLSTRMYGSLGEIIRGWQKNVFAGGLDSVPFGKVGQTIFPLFLLMPPMMELLPLLALVLIAAGLTAGGTLFVWAAISTSVTLLWWILVYVTVRENPLYALAYPLGALVLLYIFLTAVIRGRRVTWKGRTYISQ
ncbi:MAG: glycosyltransferase [Gemmatimonadaceae bacterium]